MPPKTLRYQSWSDELVISPSKEQLRRLHNVMVRRGLHGPGGIDTLLNELENNADEEMKEMAREWYKDPEQN